MNRTIRTVIALLALCLTSLLPLATGASTSDVLEPVLSPSDKHEKVGMMVAEFVEGSHYSHASVDDDLSSRVLDRYIQSLDNNRMYFLASDIEAFEHFRYRLDDVIRREPLTPVFDMFEVYRTRVRERLQFALLQLEQEPDFTVDEDYVFDRSEGTWAEDKAELDDVWRRRVKNDSLNLVLADKTWDEAAEIL